MSTAERFVIRVLDLDVEVFRKDIKNLHVAVYPPLGRVRVATPRQLGDEAVRLAVVARLAWIRKQQARIRDQARQSRRDMVDGEAHYVWGRKYRLRVVEASQGWGVNLTPDGWLELKVPGGAGRDARARHLSEWYREQLKDEIPQLVERWAPRLGVERPAWRVRRMKTKWGTCNAEAGSILINLELAKKPHECLEYIVVHELIHLIERNHTDRFYELQERYLPAWRSRRELLNAQPLGYEGWEDERAA